MCETIFELKAKNILNGIDDISSKLKFIHFLFLKEEDKLISDLKLSEQKTNTTRKPRFMTRIEEAIKQKSKVKSK